MAIVQVFTKPDSLVFEGAAGPLDKLESTGCIT